jgi:hypothetical protein
MIVRCNCTFAANRSERVTAKPCATLAFFTVPVNGGATGATYAG